jgi:hypothetical protein
MSGERHSLALYSSLTDADAQPFGMSAPQRGLPDVKRAYPRTIFNLDRRRVGVTDDLCVTHRRFRFAFLDKVNREQAV